MAQFRKKPVVVEAVQLLRSTLTEMCEHAGVGKLADGKPEVCYNADGRIGLRIPTSEGLMLGVEGDWIVRFADGELCPFKPDMLAEAFEDVRQRHQDYSVDFDPDWSKYPLLTGAIFDDQPSQLREEFRELLAEARADAVQYVHDVRVEELAKARTDERKRLLALLGVSNEDCRLMAAGNEAAVSVAKMVRALPAGQLLQALKNAGCYLDTCDACSEVFFTGSKMHDHTCQMMTDVRVDALRVARERPCTLDNCGHMRQLDAIVDLLGMTRGTRSVLDELRARRAKLADLQGMMQSVLDSNPPLARDDSHATISIVRKAIDLLKELIG